MSVTPESRVSRGNRISDEDIELANKEIALAFTILGLVDQGGLVCPACAAGKKKVQAKTGESGQPYWKCQKCKTFGTATKLLTEYQNLTFPDAVNTLLGRPTSGAAPVRTNKPVIKIEIEPSFVALADIDVYDAVRNSGSLERAQEYYLLAAHIAPEVVEEAGSTYITDAKAMHASLRKMFDDDRLIKSGVATRTASGRLWFLVNEDYCVIEPHERACSELRDDWSSYMFVRRTARERGETPPAPPFRPPTCDRDTDDQHGHVVGMQFRPSFEHKRAVDAHKAWKRRWSGFLDPSTGAALEPDQAYSNAYALAPATTGDKSPYVSPFYSIKGATPESLIGCGLRRIAALPPGQKIYNVEGFKDLLAARTMGAESYAIPGTGVMPSAKTCDILRPHTQIITLDGDEAGAHGREVLLEHYAKMSVPAREKDNIRAGMDIADILIERHASAGCPCGTCAAWRSNH